MQWNLSVDRDLGWNTGLRVSYIGQGTRDLVWAPNLNQSYIRHSITGAAVKPAPIPQLGNSE